MNDKIFSIDAAIRYGWQKMRENFWLFLGLLIVFGILTAIFSPGQMNQHGFRFGSDFKNNLLGFSWPNRTDVTPLWWRMVTYLVRAVGGLVVLKVTLLLLRNKKVSVETVKPVTRVALSYIGASLLFGAIVAIGIILLVIPGIIWAIRLRFYSYFIIEHGDTIPQAFQKSWDITRGNTMNLLSFSIIAILINVLGALVFLVGLFFTIPATLMAQAYVYDKLAGHKGHKAKD